MENNQQSEFVIIYKPSGLSYISQEFREFIGLSTAEVKDLIAEGSSLLDSSEISRIRSILSQAISQLQSELNFHLSFNHPNGIRFKAFCKADLHYDVNGNHTFGLIKFTFQYENGREFRTYQTLQSSLEDRNKIIKTFSNVSFNLIDSTSPLAEVSEAMREIGEILNVDRIYYFTYNKNNHTFSQKIEWTFEGTTPEINNPELQNLPVIDNPTLTRLFETKGFISEVISEMEEGYEKELLQSQSIQSVLLVSLLSGNETLGFIGVDDCQLKRRWSDFEISTLSSLANVITEGLAAWEAKKALSFKKAELEAILNGQKDAIFTANFQTKKVEFVNSAFSKNFKKLIIQNESLNLDDLISKVSKTSQIDLKRFIRQLQRDGYAKAQFTTSITDRFHWIDFSGKVLILEPSKEKLFLGNIRDITKEKEDETRLREAFKATQDAQKKVTELELKSLQMQMNPHFIFNALNSIQSYIINSEPLKANDYLSNFSRLIRMFLDSSRDKTFKISDEIELIKLYVEIEQLRFESLFDFELMVAPTVDMRFQIPSMILQPLIENAINHGLRFKSSKGVLRLSFSQGEEKLHVEICDNGIGIAENKRIQTGKKEGYKSQAFTITKERIELINKGKKRKIKMSIEEYENGAIEPGVKVSLSFPINREQ